MYVLMQVVLILLLLFLIYALREMYQGVRAELRQIGNTLEEIRDHLETNE